jgi:hypothetical protein
LPHHAAGYSINRWGCQRRQLRASYRIPPAVCRGGGVLRTLVCWVLCSVLTTCCCLRCVLGVCYLPPLPRTGAKHTVPGARYSTAALGAWLTAHAFAVLRTNTLARRCCVYAQRGVYPPNEFSAVQKYGLTMLVTTDTGLQDYLANVLKQIRSTHLCCGLVVVLPPPPSPPWLLLLRRPGLTALYAAAGRACIAAWLMAHMLQKIVLVVTGVDSGETLERWSFDIEADKEVTQDGCAPAHPGPAACSGCWQELLCAEEHMMCSVLVPWQPGQAREAGEGDHEGDPVHHPPDHCLGHVLADAGGSLCAPSLAVSGVCDRCAGDRCVGGGAARGRQL